MIATKKKNFIVEYRPTGIRVARVSSYASPVIVEDVLEVNLVKEGDAAEKLRAFAGVKSNGYIQAVCTIYPETRLLRHLTLDSSRGKESEFVLDFLKSQVGVNPDEYSVFCLSAKDGLDADLVTFNKKPILVCGARSSEIVEIQHDLVKYGIYPNRLEVGSASTSGVLKEYLADDEHSSPMLYLEIDSKSTNAVIVGPKGVEMARRIDCGADHIASALKEEMNLKDELAADKILQSKDFDLGPIAPKILRKLLRELQSSIGFFEVQTGLSVSHLYCTNRGRSQNWLQDSICDLLNLSVVGDELAGWLSKVGVTFSSEEVASKVDCTWIGLFAHLIELRKEKAA